MSEAASIFTIGHSTHEFPYFVELLKKHGVTAVVDVRSTPFSRHHPQYNRQNLEAQLQRQGIQYFFLGQELGARPSDPTCYVDGRVRFARLAASKSFQSGIERILEEAQRNVVAVMCAEKEPLNCHRSLLVARALVEQGVAVTHILADGNSEPHGEALERLVKLTDLPYEDLLRSHADIIAEALAIQEEKVANTDGRMTTAT